MRLIASIDRVLIQKDEHAFPIMLAWKLGVTDKANYNAHIKPAVNLRGGGERILPVGAWGVPSNSFFFPRRLWGCAPNTFPSFDRPVL